MSAKRIFANSLKYHKMSAAEVAESLGVRVKQVRNWASEFKIRLAPSAKEIEFRRKKDRLIRDPDAGSLIYAELGSRHGMTAYSARKILIAAGVRDVVRSRVRIPLDPDVVWLAKQLDAWARPQGMSEHVLALIRARRVSAHENHH